MFKSRDIQRCMIMVVSTGTHFVGIFEVNNIIIMKILYDFPLDLETTFQYVGLDLLVVKKLSFSI